MSWSWRLEQADGTQADGRDLPRETFPSQSDAESWLGEHWRELLDGGAAQVTLLEDDRVVYGPMGLDPA